MSLPLRKVGAKPRRTLRVFGDRGKSARVFLERGHNLIRVQWRVNGLLKTESYPNTPEHRETAILFAQGVAHSLQKRKAVQRAMTVRQIWERYAEHEFAHLRPKTRTLNAESWRKWELVVGRDTIAEDLGVDTMATFRAALERQGLAVNSIGRLIRGVKLVYNWAERHELIQRNRLHLYRFKVGKDKRPAKVPEYHQEEFDALCRALPMEGRNWRAGGVLRLCGFQGTRQNAVRHLQWDDINFEAGTIRWRPEWDKLGRDWTQPLRAQSRAALESIRARKKPGSWVFPKPRPTGKPDEDPTYSAQAFWFVLVNAEKRANVTHKRGRGAHGLRRKLATDVMAATGNLKTAADAIGDKDLRVLQDHYLMTRDGAVRDAFAKLDGATPETVTPTVTGSEA